MYALKCIAPDGAYVTESRDFETVEQAWEHADDMGSRWIFYPIRVVTGSAESDLSRIVSLPDYYIPDYYKGKSLRTLCAAITENSKEVCEALNAGYPLPL